MANILTRQHTISKRWQTLSRDSKQWQKMNFPIQDHNFRRMNELLEKTANIKTTLDINPRPVAPNLKIATRICRDCGKVIWEITDIPGLYTMCGCVAIKRFKMMSEKKALKMADQYRYPGSD